MKNWPPHEIRGLKDQLDRLEDSIRNRPDGRSDDDHIWLTRFFVVRTCGYLEQVVSETTREHLRQTSGGRALDFSLTWLEQSRNPSKSNLIDLVRRFGSGLKESLEQLLAEDDSRLARELTFLVDRRNRIAHGLNEGLTETKAVSLKRDVETLVEWFVTNLKPK